jgi:hypothetical protein
MQIVEKADGPVAMAEEMQRVWLKRAEQVPAFPGVDPAHLDVASQEYREALEQVTGQLVRLARVAESKKGAQRKG